MNDGMNDGQPRELAETVRKTCLRTLVQVYEEAKISGLCHDGAWEAAVQALRALDADALLAGQPGERAD